MAILHFAFLLTPVQAGTDLDPGLVAQVRADEQARIDTVNRLMPTVVCMFSKGSRVGGGSGVVIDPDGYGLSNYHVVAGMMRDRAGEGGLSDHKLYPFDVLGIDPTGDVAMFKMHRREPFAFASLGDSSILRVGDPSIAMGNPFLLADDYTPTVTFGIISGLQRYQRGAGAGERALRYTDCIQIDTSINPGNSGGPLFDNDGRLIGINGRISIEERMRVNVGIGHAISINQIKRFMPALRAGLVTQHATAGFTLLDMGSRTIVNEILADSESYEKGLRLGDEIVQFDGRDVHSANHFASILGTYPGGWPVELVYRRKNQVNRFWYRLEDLPLPGDMVTKKTRGANPVADHPVAQAANRRAARRTFELYQQLLGGRDLLDAVKSIRFDGKRTLQGKPDAEPESIDHEETLPEFDAPEALEPGAFEQRIRWTLMTAYDDLMDLEVRVVGGDEVRGVVVGVLECKPEAGTRFAAAFDDSDGRLLRVEFKDPVTLKDVRYEYDDYRRTSYGLNQPHRRWLYLDDALYATDEFDKIEATGGGK